jgi:hypothetical protein
MSLDALLAFPSDGPVAARVLGKNFLPLVLSRVFYFQLGIALLSRWRDRTSYDADDFAAA